MSNWKDSLKGLGSSAAKALATGAKNVISASQEQIKESNRKRQIVDKIYEGTIKELARQRGLHPEPFLGGRPTIDDYKDSIVSNLSLRELIEFANKKRIDIRDVQDSINQEVVRKERKRLEEDTSLSDEFKEIANCVRDFKPLNNYRREYQYQAELTQWLKSRFPDTNIEVQRGSSRPDIVVKGIGIEVKGPTVDEDLNTIADKLVRYSQWFPKGIIIALFSVNVNPHRYEEWFKGIKNTRFPGLANIEIVKK
jgi:hypothetical protein